MLLKKIFKAFINSQIFLSRKFDTLLPKCYRIDGNSDYVRNFVPGYFQKDLRVYDIGGGKNPLVSLELKKKFSLFVVGLDIDRHELALAPVGAYDETICDDITAYQGAQDADLLICNAMLEHVGNVDTALANITKILKPGGLAIIFVPSRNALYARLNLLLPERIKKHILYSIYPTTRQKQGFPSYYDRCTPRDIKILAKRHGLEVESQRIYFISSYFFCFFPAYLLWRIWILIFHYFAGEQAAETFSLAFRKPC